MKKSNGEGGVWIQASVCVALLYGAPWGAAGRAPALNWALKCYQVPFPSDLEGHMAKAREC